MKRSSTAAGKPPTVTHRNLDAWQAAVDLADQVYRLTDEFPRDELFGLTGQLRRAAVSIAANIAEGAGRNTSREYLHFLGIAAGSCAELDTLLEIALRRDLVQSNDKLIESLRRAWALVLGLRRAVKNKVKLDD